MTRAERIAEKKRIEAELDAEEEEIALDRRIAEKKARIARLRAEAVAPALPIYKKSKLKINWPAKRPVEREEKEREEKEEPLRLSNRVVQPGQVISKVRYDINNFSLSTIHMGLIARTISLTATREKATGGRLIFISGLDGSAIGLQLFGKDGGLRVNSIIARLTNLMENKVRGGSGGEWLWTKLELSRLGQN